MVAGRSFGLGADAGIATPVGTSQTSTRRFAAAVSVSAIAAPRISATAGRVEEPQ
jgi:hypothetical protein